MILMNLISLSIFKGYSHMTSSKVIRQGTEAKKSNMKSARK